MYLISWRKRPDLYYEMHARKWCLDCCYDSNVLRASLQEQYQATFLTDETVIETYVSDAIWNQIVIKLDWKINIRRTVKILHY